MLKWLTAGLLSAMLWLGIFVVLRALEVSLFTVPGLAIVLLLLAAIGVLVAATDRLIAAIERLIPPETPWSTRMVALNQLQAPQAADDPEQRLRRRARLRFRTWKPGADVTIH
jgi:hypothetical protein